MRQLLTLVLGAAVVILLQQCEATPSPIVLIPGVMGCQLQVMDQTSSKLCSTGRKYKELWISLLRVTVYNICAKKELPLRYDANTNSYHNNTEVKIHVPGFGGTSSIEYLIPGLSKSFEYFHGMVEYFVDRDYERGKTIRGAPYDWRLAADELEKRGYFHRLKSLVEDMYNTNGNTKVTLVVHSMGGLVSLHFLTGFSGINQAWKDKYIHAYVTLSSPWAGATAVVQTAVSGYHDVPDMLLFAYDLISDLIVPIARTFESIPWLFPKASVFGNDAFISTPSKQYTFNDYEQLFRDINAPNANRAFQGLQGILLNYPAPNVPTYCFYGVGVPTPEKFTYSKDLTPSNVIGLKPVVTNSDGDGSVNTVSSRVCRRWSSMPSKYSFRHKTFSTVKHIKILSNIKVLEEIGAIVGAPPKRKSWWGKR